jgi:choline dehydrogenase-like flavoprotein
MVKSKKKVVIIGGGTAGLTIANSIQENFDVIVIEKSKYKKYPIWYKVPLFIGLLLRRKKTKYISKRNFVLTDGRHIPFFESNLLGGASVINGCVHMLGSELQWNKVLKKFNYNYVDLIESYKNLYSLDTKNQNKISLITAHQNCIDEAFINTLKAQDIHTGNMDFSNKQACGPILNTAKKYFRASVLSLTGRKYYKTYMGESVENIMFNDSGKVIGVKTNKQVFYSDYVILSGGVIGTCDLLLREKNNKKAHNFLNNLVVGNNVQDHTNLRINVLTNKSIDSLNEISESIYKKIILVFKHFSGRSTLMKGTGATSAAHLDLDRDGKIDVRIQIVQFSESGRHGSDGKLFNSSKPGFSISITAINPKSKGTVKLDGANNIVDPMYLSSKKDIELLKLALKFCLKLLRSDAMSEHILKIEGESEIENNPDKYIADNFYSGYHLIGGSHDAINSNFEVHNTKDLYVCDASIFNKYAASNIHSSVVLIANIFAKKFINQNFHL